MNTLTSETQDPKALKVFFKGHQMRVVLDNLQQIIVPIDEYPRLHFATRAEQRNFRLTAGGKGIHWPDLDEDISLQGLLQGRGSSESPQSVLRWLVSRRTRILSQKPASEKIKIAPVKGRAVPIKQRFLQRGAGYASRHQVS